MIYAILFGIHPSQYTPIKFDDYDLYMECNNITPDDLDLALVSTKFRPVGINCDRGYISYQADYTISSLFEYQDMLKDDYGISPKGIKRYLVVWECAGGSRMTEFYDDIDSAREHLNHLHTLPNLGYAVIYQCQRVETLETT